MIEGCYINLDRSANRLSRCQSQIQSVHLSNYFRFNAVDGSDAIEQIGQKRFSEGKLGCWLSHLKAMEGSLDHDSHQHILEDDFLFTKDFKTFHDNFEDHIEKLQEWDIIFCDVDVAGMHNVAQMNSLIRRVGQLESNHKIGFEDAEKIYAAGNSSYIVNRTSKVKVYELMKKGLESGLPNDLYMRKLIREGKLRAFVTLPFVTTVSDDFNDSTILGNISDTNPSIMFATLFRRSLAWGADTKGLLKTFQDRINQLAPIGDRGMIYAHLVAHFVSDDYKSY